MTDKQHKVKTIMRAEEENALYVSLEKSRLKEAILLPDIDKFLLFTRMLRITHMISNAKITHKKMP